METLGIIASTILLVFCLFIIYRMGIKAGYKKGFTQGVKDTLKEWRKTL